jgi:S-disulfanyl-L-cysteine oxidoreductase SoxD
MSMLRTLLLSAVVGGASIAIGATLALAQQGYGGPYDFGTTPSAEEIAAIDIDAMPDGRGLPPGSGTYGEGREIFMTQCASCHGENLEGIPEVGIGGDRLIGGRGSLASGNPVKTIESYWPYATTVFDYVKRAMPFHAPGSLTDDEVYGVIAFILGEAEIIGEDDVMNAETLPQVQMPNRDGFVADPRPDVFGYD